MTTTPADRNRFARGLGRIQQHDPASRGFAIPRQGATLRDVTHAHHGIPSNQRNAGACTAFTCGDMLMTWPLWRHGDVWDDDRDFRLYGRITALDDFPGAWTFVRIVDEFTVEGSGEDTGSSSVGMWRALKEAGTVDRVEWAFGLDHALEAIMRAPLAVGIPWRSAMFDITSEGQVKYTGDVVGGHEIMFGRMRVAQRRLWFLNHWLDQDGTPWGVKGWAWMSFDDFGQALSEGGDVAQFLRTSAWKPPKTA